MPEFWYPLSVPTIGDEEIDAATEVLRSGHTTMGDRVEQFEEAFARYVGADYAVMVNSGSSADLLMAFASPRNSQFPTAIIPAVTWPTHVWSWHIAGWDIRFIDVDGLNASQDAVDDAIWSRHEMLSLVHLMGVPCDVSARCRITEDCCEALGSPVGNRGEMATWSFFFSHHMTTMEGGMVTTPDASTASHLRSLRSHGWARHEGKDPYEFVTMGFNLRPTEISAAVGLVQLRRLDEFNKLRAENHRIFTEALAGCPGIELPTVSEWVTPSWFGLPFFADDRDGLAAYLGGAGVETRPILAGNLTRQPAFARWADQGPFPGADRVHDHGLYVGLHPTADSGVEQVAELIAEFCG